MSDRRDQALAYVAGHNVATLATHGDQGPWAAAVFYVSDGFTLTFLSSPTTRHAQDLEANPQCAAAIHEDYEDWPQIKGLQLEGHVHRLSGSKKVGAIARYGAKFPVVQAAKAPALIRAALEKVAWYEFTPTRCFFIDNSQGFGHRDEITLQASPFQGG